MKADKNIVINLPETITGLVNDYAKGLLSTTSFTHILDRMVREYNDRQGMNRFSEKALALLRKDNVDLTMSNKQFSTKYKVKYGLVQDHLKPIRELSTALRNNTIQPKALLSNAEICWILQSEHKCLEDKKYKSKRPNGWEAAYAECGIKTTTIK